MEKKWYMGIDVSKATLDVAVYEKEACRSTKGTMQVSNDKKGFSELLKWIKGYTKKLVEVVVCLEHTGVYATEICAWFEKTGIDYSLLNPLHLKRSMGLVRGKDDRIDAQRIAKYCYLHREELTYTKLPSEVLQKLKFLSNEREQVVVQLAKLKAKEKPIKEATKATLSRHKRSIKELEQQLKEIDDEILETINSENMIKENCELLTSIKGIGIVNAVAIIVATRNFTLFIDPRKYACYIGVAPFPNRSGTSVRGGTRVSFYGNRRLKAIISQAAIIAVQHDKQLKEYYEKKRKEGKEKGTVLNAVKYKLVLRMFSVIQRREKYIDELDFKVPSKTAS